MLFAAALTASLVALAPSNATPQPMWVFFRDHGGLERASAPSDSLVTERALARRAQRGTITGLSSHDLPVHPAYVAAIQSLGGRIRTESRWLNAVSVDIDPRQRKALANLRFVDHVQPVRTGRHVDPIESQPESPLAGEGVAGGGDYGQAFEQIAQMDLLSLHQRGFRGAGMVIGVLDTGFHRAHEAFFSAEHPLTVLAEHDFINDDPNTDIEEGDPEAQHRHGTWILGTMASYLPGSILGAAYEASYVLAKTEVQPTETPIEEDYYVAGLEFVEAQGADLATSSLGYIDWYTPADLDGETAVTTLAVNIATANGLVCLTAAGNAGHDEDAGTNHLLAPADAFDVIACGAVASDGVIADFSSDGPSADGRVKPEILARGVATVTITSSITSGLSGVSGTSLSTPLVAGAVACILQARPDFTVADLRTALFASATDGSADPLFVRGYGIIQADAAAQSGRAPADLNLDGSVNSVDLALLLGAWGGCGDCGHCPFDLNDDCTVDAADLSIVLGGWTL